jgi:hypothetical protein
MFVSEMPMMRSTVGTGTITTATNSGSSFPGVEEEASGEAEAAVDQARPGWLWNL